MTQSCPANLANPNVSCTQSLSRKMTGLWQWPSVTVSQAPESGQVAQIHENHH